MSQTVEINGVSYTIPEPGEEQWGQDVTDYLVALSAGLLQKAGGSFILTAEIDFGANYGLKSVYYKTRAANIASAGQFRLGNTETIAWRNAANDDDLSLTVDSGDRLDFNGENIPSQSEMDAKLTDPLTTDGDLIVRDSGATTRLAKGSDGLVLSMVSGSPAWASVAGTGDVVGPSSSTDNAIARFDGTSGKAIQEGDPTIADGGAINFKRTSTAVSVSSAGEQMIGVTDTTAARTITLADADKVAGRMITVKDESGGAAGYNITITPQTGTIDGAASIIINSDYGSKTVYSDGSNWFTLGAQMANPKPFKHTTVSGDNATVLKASSGKVFSVVMRNTSDNDFFLKFYDKATSPVAGTDTPLYVIQLWRATSSPNFLFDAGNGNFYTFPEGMYFENGIAFTTHDSSSGYQDSDTGGATAGGEISFTYE